MVARIFKIIVIVITALIVLVIWAGMSLFKGIDLGGDRTPDFTRNN